VGHPSAEANRWVERPSTDKRHGGRCVRMRGRPNVSERMSLDVIFHEDIQSNNPGGCALIIVA
jgi:hypothetical protein